MTRCPRCRMDVTRGIRSWRRQVAAAHAFHQDLTRRLQEAAGWIERGRRGMSAEYDGAEVDGLHLAQSISSTALAALVFSHHGHISFVVSERDRGKLPAGLSI